jgi:hypothetical protein
LSVQKKYGIISHILEKERYNMPHLIVVIVNSGIDKKDKIDILSQMATSYEKSVSAVDNILKELVKEGEKYEKI